MSVLSVVPDQQACTLVLTAEYPATVEQVWQLWADPRLLERWWGPPTYPATVTEHDLRVGGVVRYAMKGPEGEHLPGWWRLTAVDAPTGLAFDDAFGEPDAPSDMPVSHCDVVLSDVGDGTTRMVLSTRFASPKDMQQLLEMGMVEGLTLAAGQIDDLLPAAVAP